jgi:aryl-alcohol dehydrogenase-like predicted oxidoreductase
MAQTQFARVRLGERGPDVSRLCLSGALFGEGVDAHQAFDIINRYRDSGGNFIDATGNTADGASERIVGKALQHQRQRWVIAATAGGQGREHPGRLSGKWVRQALDQSLDRMGFDRIDLFYLHLNEHMNGLEEAMECVGELMESGRIGGWGFANVRAWRIAELVRMADCLDVPRPIAAQPCYHALHRSVETDYLPACVHFGIGAVAYAPLARGILSEEYSQRIELSSRMLSDGGMCRDIELRPAAEDAVRAIARHLQPSGRAMTGFALQWVLANRLVSSVLIRPGSLEQLEALLSAAATPYTPDDEAFMNELVPSGNFIETACMDLRWTPEGRVVD